MLTEMLRDLVATARRVPDYLLGAPSRAVLRLHAPLDTSDAQDGSGPAMCLAHRRPVAWPCPDAQQAADALAAHPGWRS